MQAEISTLKHVDVDGKDQFFLVIQKGEMKYRMSIGQKTYDTIARMDMEEAVKNTVKGDDNSKKEGKKA